MQDESSYYVVAENKRLRSIKIMYLTLFLNSTGFSITLPSLWPYLQHLSPSVNYSFLGIAAAGYSIGQMMASPALGKWYSARGRVTLPLQACMFLGVIGNLIYAVACIHKDNGSHSTNISLWMVCVGRIVAGLSAGCIALCRGFCGEAAHMDERTSVMASGSVAQSLGFIAGPGLSLLGSLAKQGGRIGPLEVNQYTIPGYISVMLIIFNSIVIALLFREELPPTDFMVNSRMSSAQIVTIGVNWKGVAVCNALFFIAMMSFTVFETLGTPILQAEYSLSQSEAVKWSSVSLTATSIFSLVTFMLANPMDFQLGMTVLGLWKSVLFSSKRFGERRVMTVAFFVCALCYVLLFPFGPGKIPKIEWAPLTNVTITNITEKVGCAWENTWCHTQKRLSIYQFVFANSLLLLSYPLCVVLIFSRISKILGEHKQGMVMGVLTSVGSLSRAMGPAIFSALFQFRGPQLVSVVMTVACMLGGSLMMLFYKHLEDFDVRLQRLNSELFR